MAPLSRENRREYGAAVLDAIRALNRAASQRALTAPSNLCYESRCASSDGRTILAAIKRQHESAFHDRDGNIWSHRRSKDELIADYEAAIEAKRAAKAAPVA